MYIFLWRCGVRDPHEITSSRENIKISHSEDTRLPILWVGGAYTTKIMPPKISLAYMYLLHIDWIFFCFYYKFKFCFPEILRVVGGADTPIITPPKLS